MTQFLSEKELDKRGILTRTTRWRMRQKGQFPKPIKISARRTAYKLDDIEAWIAERSAMLEEVA